MKEHLIRFGQPVREAKDPDPRLPAELSLDELMRGDGCSRYSDLYEMALLDRLNEATAQASFIELDSGSPDPLESVIEDLRGYNRLATEQVLPNHDLDAGDVNAGNGSSHRLIMIETPEQFPYDRYVLSYLQPPPEYLSPIVIADEGAAKEIWRGEQPVFNDTSASLPDVYPGSAQHHRTRRKLLTGEDKDPQSVTPRETRKRAHESWLLADPGDGDYERRITGIWQLQPVIDYKVRMNFREDIGILDFHGENGLMRQYPLGDGEPGSIIPEGVEDPISEVMGPRRGFSPSTGELSVFDCREALELEKIMGERFNEAGVICEPDVVLMAPGGAVFKLTLPWIEQERIAEAMSAAYEEPDHKEHHKEIFPPEYDRDHRVLSGLASVVPDQEKAQKMLRAADSTLLSGKQCGKLRHRLDDPRIPERRKAVLRQELASFESDENEALKRLGTTDAEVAGLVASLGKERELLYEALEQVHLSSGLMDEGVRRFIQSTMREIQRFREEDSQHYG